VIKDFKFTVNQAVRPVEKRFDKMKKNIKFSRQSQDDNWVSASTPERTIRGIDDPLISGSASDSGIFMYDVPLRSNLGRLKIRCR
jgi:hypothetical protein